MFLDWRTSLAYYTLINSSIRFPCVSKIVAIHVFFYSNYIFNAHIICFNYLYVSLFYYVTIFANLYHSSFIITYNKHLSSPTLDTSHFFLCWIYLDYWIFIILRWFFIFTLLDTDFVTKLYFDILHYIVIFFVLISTLLFFLIFMLVY